MSPDIAPQTSQRALALDAVRGFAILTMCLSGVLPKNLPLWMYHAQVPTYSGYIPAIPGITWVDLVFPMFLFSMGAAFPLALAGRISRGVPPHKLIGGIVFRGLSLVFFAVYIQNTNPWAWAEPDGALKWILALVAFAILFLIYMRYPAKWPAALQWSLRAGGVLLAIGLMSIVKFPDLKLPGGSVTTGWSVRRNDIIIMVLANMAVSGSIIWLLTRNSLVKRIAVLLGVWGALAAYNAGDGSWLHWLLKPPSITINETKYSIDWMYNFGWQKYLFIVIPGTIVGDLLLAWMKRPQNSDPPAGEWSRARLWAISGIMVMLVIGLLWGLYDQNVGASLLQQKLESGAAMFDMQQYKALRFARVLVTAFLAMAICAAAWTGLFRKPGGYTERFLRALFGWGIFWLVLGLMLDPVELGIHKDPSNMSYYFTTTAISIFALVAFTIWIDLLGIRRTFALLTYSGQNPMIAYAAIRLVMPPLVQLIPLQTLADKVLTAPWAMFIFSLFKTAIVGGVASLFTRLKIYWRT